MHILITGGIGVGKSTLIQKLLRELRQQVYGFRTKKAAADASGTARVHIYPASGNEVFSDDNVAGLSMARGAKGFPDIFDSLGTSYLSGIPENAVVLMDELGIMETEAATFCSAVLSVLDRPCYVIAAVKPAKTNFLESVRSHQNALLYEIRAENRDMLYEQIQQDLRRRDPQSPFLRES